MAWLPDIGFVYKRQDKCLILSLYILAFKIIVGSLASSKGDQELFKYNFMSSWI